MKWQAILAGAVASALVTCVASADVRIVGDPGGEVSSYIQKFSEIRDSGQRIVIDGPCLSACTLLTGIVPRDHVCITRRAALGFHAASYYDDASRALVEYVAASPSLEIVDRSGTLSTAVQDIRSGKAISAIHIRLSSLNLSSYWRA